MNPETALPWRGGWYSTAHALPSPHCDARPEGAAVDLLVVHSISLPPGQYGGADVAALFLGTLDCGAHPYYEQLRGLRVSAHFFIRRDGALLQFVDCEQRAWHAGVSHYRGRSQCNDDSIGIELEGLEGEAFEPAQYAALAELARALALRYPIAHVAGHEHIAPGRKADPGPGFDWARFAKLLCLPHMRLPVR
jgi:AmpD protein